MKKKKNMFYVLYTWIRRSFILVLCWSSMMVSSFRSFCTNSVAALFFWVRREAQMARNTTVLSSLGFPDGLSITPTRTPGLAFCMDARKQSKCHTKVTYYPWEFISQVCKMHSTFTSLPLHIEGLHQWEDVTPLNIMTWHPACDSITGSRKWRNEKFTHQMV